MRLKLENCEFEASLCYIARPYLKKSFMNKNKPIDLLGWGASSVVEHLLTQNVPGPDPLPESYLPWSSSPSQSSK
jgi:hypothetical protein